MSPKWEPGFSDSSFGFRPNRDAGQAIKQAKSAIRRPANYEYLGFGFAPTYKKGDKGKYQLVVSKKNLKRLKAKIKLITRKTIPGSFALLCLAPLEEAQ